MDGIFVNIEFSVIQRNIEGQFTKKDPDNQILNKLFI